MERSLLSKYRPVVDSFVLTNNKQLSAVLRFSDNQLVSALSEAVYNFCIIGSIPLNEESKRFF